ncbi:MAG: HAMP domain-containing protein [Actinobacteria bacterium]|nr:HAMP domain-containing protein [Actinomycetota bacterium]
MRALRDFFAGIRGRVFLVILLAGTAAGVLVGAASYRIAQSSLKKQVYENLANISHDIELIAEEVWVPTLERQMVMIAGAAEIIYRSNPSFQGMEQDLTEAGIKIPGIRRLNVFLPNGYLIASSDPGYKVGRVEELQGLEAGETAVIPFRMVGDPPEQERVMTVAAPVVLEGKVAGILAGDITPEGLSGIMGSLRVGVSGEAYFVNSSRQFVTLPPLADEGRGLEILGEAVDTEGIRRVAAGESGVSEYLNYDGRRVVGSYAWIEGLGWGLVVEEDAAQAFSRLKALRVSVALIVIGMAIIAFAASLFLSRRLTKPLVKLKRGAERLGLGDLEQRIEPEGAEEFRALARSFNRMAEAVRSSHELMEEKVRESTGELRALNEVISSLRRTSNPDEILQKTMQAMLDFTAYEEGWCYLAGEESWKMLYRRCSPGRVGLLPGSVTPGDGLLGKIAVRREAVFWGAAEESGDAELSRLAPGSSMAVVPLCSPTRVLGLMCLVSKGRRELPREARETVRAMADEAGIALENALLYLEVQAHVAELEKANLELRGLDEMKSNFISSVTHELKQPLALIGGYAQTIYRYYDSLTYEEEMQCLRVIIDRTRFLASLVEDLLDISLLETGRFTLQLEEVDLEALARKAVDENVVTVSGQPAEVRFEPGFPTLRADAKRMQQVLTNLLSNAVKFTGGKGRIGVVGTVLEDKVRVRVEDEGEGIDPAHLERIFDRFFQADAGPSRPYTGVGLGLFICRQLVEAHGGRIWAENRPEGGAAFTFELPVTQAAGG